MSENELIDAMKREALRIEEDATYSSKGHFNAEANWILRNYFLGVPATILAALAGATLVKSCPELASICALLSSLLTGLMTFLKPNERASIHRSAGVQFLALKNEIRIFREVELLQAERLNDLTEKLKNLSSVRNDLNQNSPSIPRSAFLAARKGIEDGEAAHQIDQGRK